MKTERIEFINGFGAYETCNIVAMFADGNGQETWYAVVRRLASNEFAIVRIDGWPYTDTQIYVGTLVDK